MPSFRLGNSDCPADRDHAAINCRCKPVFQHYDGAISWLDRFWPSRPVSLQRDRGLYSYGAGGQVKYVFNPQWAAHTLVEYEQLTGSAANAPIVTHRGSPNQFTFGAGATYSFIMHQFW
jgi:hypothetical protein